MKRALTREEMRELDRKAIEEYKIPGIILMENAGRNVAEEILKMIHNGKIPADPPGKQDTKLAVLCGKGNNGGDGFVAARHLYNRYVPVRVFLFAEFDSVLKAGDAGVNLRILLNMKVPVEEVRDAAGVNEVLKVLGDYTLIVDALFGTGLSGEVKEPYRTLIKGVNNLNKPVVSVDIPSGLDCNTGEVLGAAVMAARTVTFAADKKGFHIGSGPEYTGEIFVTDISIPRELILH